MSALTATQLILRILEKTGASNRPQTIDRVSAGDLTQAVIGIAVTAMASLDALARAAAANANLVLTYDPAFWSTADDLDHLEADALFARKRDFVRAHNMVVFNLHDHWRDRMPDGVAEGMAQALGWQAEPNSPNLFRRPATTLVALARELSGKLGDKTLRVVGDPALPVMRVATAFGNLAQMPGITLLNGPIDVLVCGYTHEWEVVEYCQDMVAAGLKKGLILLGENASVAMGMKHCADWIGGFVTEAPVTFIPQPEPYWNP